MVFDAFEGRGRRDRVGTVGVAVALVGGVVLMIGAGIGGRERVGVEEGTGVRLHFHLGMTTAEGDFGSVGGIFVDEEIEDIDGLGILCGDRWRGRRCFWGRIDDCNGIVGVTVEGIFDVCFARYKGGWSRVDFDGFLELFRGLFFVESALVLLGLGEAGLARERCQPLIQCRFEGRQYANGNGD